MEDIEKTIRKRWLCFTILSFVVGSFLSLRVAISSGFFSFFKITTYQSAEHFLITMLIFGYFITFLIGFYASYFVLAYVKKGIKFLCFVLLC